MLKVKAFAFNFFEENTYLVWDDATKEAVVIDPGMMFDDERETFDNEVDSLGLKVKTVLQMLLIMLLTVAGGRPLATLLEVAATFMTLYSMVEYVWQNRAVLGGAK